MLEAEARLRELAEQHGQERVFRFWGELGGQERAALLADLEQVDFKLMERLTEEWIRNEPAPERYAHIAPIPVIPPADCGRPDAKEAWDAGEAALCAGRVGLLVVAGGQGTRLGFDGPKGAYPIGPVSKKSIFAFHAEKIHNLRQRYGQTLPWYIMVSEANAEATRTFFRENAYFGLREEDIKFFTQRMIPCLDEEGRFMLEAPGRLARNPNGHGGTIPALVENAILDDARARGVDLFSYFQVDNWAANIGDPFFIGYHVLRNAEMSSKNHRKNGPREAVGVHCLCDRQYRVIEYSELDIYPQLLETDENGEVIFYAGNPAIHIISADFVQRIYNKFDEFPWHRAHKKTPYIDENGKHVKPGAPNAYKFETFIFDALRFCRHEPVALEIDRPGEFTPIKVYAGDDSVESVWAIMAEYWAQWIEAAGGIVPRDGAGRVTVAVEISPQFALTKDQFIAKTRGHAWPAEGPIAFDAEGDFVAPPA